MSGSNFLPFSMQENAYIQDQRRQALAMPMIPVVNPFRAYQNPYTVMSSAPPLRSSLNRNNRFLGVRHNNSSMIQKLHQLHVRMQMERRFGIRANRAAVRAPYFPSRLVFTRQVPVMNHRVVGGANFARFEADNSAQNTQYLEGSSAEIHDGHKEEKIQDVGEHDEELDLRLKL